MLSDLSGRTVPGLDNPKAVITTVAHDCILDKFACPLFQEQASIRGLLPNSIPSMSLDDVSAVDKRNRKDSGEGHHELVTFHQEEPLHVHSSKDATVLLQETQEPGIEECLEHLSDCRLLSRSTSSNPRRREAVDRAPSYC